MNQLPDDERWSQWQGWYAAAHDDVLGLAHQRHVWKNLVAMLQANPAIEHHEVINRWMVNSYSQSMATGIRRQWDGTRRRPTLGCLLKELAAHPEVLTRDRYEAQADGATGPAIVAGWFAWASPDRHRLDPEVVALDIEVLNEGTKGARDWVNQAVAHYGPDRITDPIAVTFGELDRGLDIVAGLIQRYHLLFHPGAMLAHVTPLLPLGWQQMFETAWMSSGFRVIEAENLG